MEKKCVTRPKSACVGEYFRIYAVFYSIHISSSNTVQLSRFIYLPGNNSNKEPEHYDLLALYSI